MTTGNAIVALISAGVSTSKYPPAKPGALMIGPLKAAEGVADATPVSFGHLKVANQRHRFN
jgi:hypothetical protein